MAISISKGVLLEGEDEEAFNSLTSAADQTTFMVAKLSAGLAPQLMATLSTGANILALLSSSDQKALSSLISAVKGMP
jgi:hypothetical protein